MFNSVSAISAAFPLSSEMNVAIVKADTRASGLRRKANRARVPSPSEQADAGLLWEENCPRPRLLCAPALVRRRIALLGSGCWKWVSSGVLYAAGGEGTRSSYWRQEPAHARRIGLRPLTIGGSPGDWSAPELHSCWQCSCCLPADLKRRWQFRRLRRKRGSGVPHATRRGRS